MIALTYALILATVLTVHALRTPAAPSGGQTGGVVDHPRAAVSFDNLHSTENARA